MTHVQVAGSVCHVADDAFFWLEPGEARTIALRVRSGNGTPLGKPSLTVRAWNAPEANAQE